MTEPIESECDLTVVAIAQSEGLLLHRTLRSIQTALAELTGEGLRSEIIVSLVAPTVETKAFVERSCQAFRLLEVEENDRGQSRNLAVEQAKGKYVAFVDAGALVSHNWFRTALHTAQQCTSEDFAIHTAVTLEFGQRVFVHEHLPSRNPRVRLAECIQQPYWSANFLAPRSTLIKLPFSSSLEGSGFGHAAWHWYCNLLAAGGVVAIAPESCSLVRDAFATEAGIRLDNSSGLIRPTPLLEARNLIHLRHQRTEAAAERAVQAANAQGPASHSLVAGLRELVHSAPQRISKLTESYPPLQKSLGYAYRKVVGPVDARSRVPHWLLAQWEALATIDPVIYPDTESLTFLETVRPSPSAAATVYETVCQSLAAKADPQHEPQFTHVYLLPWLKRGGAEHEAIHYIQLTASCDSHRVLVVMTDGSESPWRDRLPKNVEVLDYWAASHALHVRIRQRLLAQLLVQLQPNVVHLVSAQLGSQSFVRFGEALSSISRLYAPAFCADISPEGKLMSYVVTYLPKYARYLTAIHSDNQCVLNYLEETFALDPKKMFTHYQPVVIEEQKRAGERPSRSTLQVLWAGRLDRQKRPDLLLAIAKECSADDIHFHVYGSSQLSWEQANVDFASAANVTYHGPFDGLGSLPIDEYDVFLNTSQWDGMPNILLEATALGLPIVSSQVGGIGELIESGETGLLACPFDDVAQYVAALRRMKGEPELRARCAANCRRIVAERHSWEHFAKDLNRLPGYCHEPIDLAKAHILPRRNLAPAPSLNTGQQK